MFLNSRSHLALFLAAFGITASLEGDADACGGCFVPPENNTVVTDHRMVLSVSKDQTTLYDQIRYQGAPESFAWILPIKGTVEVGLSSDVLFAGLDSRTSTQVVAPPRNCPPPPNCGFGDARAGANAAGASNREADNSDVVVNKQETVGPYATVQLSVKGGNTEALNQWLAANGFKIPPDIAPILASYVKEESDFLALKLVPGASINAMRPVRVTTKGASPSLPLRMVAAGTGPLVGITLWVVGEGRYEPSTFPTFTIAESDLVWDWNANASNYKALRTSKSQASGGRAWELESSTDLAAPSFVSWTTGTVGMGGTNTSYLPVTKDGRIVQSAREAAKDDLDHLLQGLPTNAPIRVTRLRADLSRAALERDLSISASFDQSVISNVRQVTREANVPQCPVFDGCRQVGLAPRPTPPNSPPPGANPPGQEPGSGASMVALTCHAAPQTTLGSSGAAGLGLAGFVVSLVTWRRRRPGNNSRG